MNDESYMKKAIEIAKANPQHPYGAVIVSNDGNVMATGVNTSSKGALYHGEIVALQDLYAKYDKETLQQHRLTIYSTAEPCPMCSSALLWAGFRGIVFGTSIETLVKMGRPQITLSCREVAAKCSHQKVDIRAHVCKDACDALFSSATAGKS